MRHARVGVLVAVLAVAGCSAHSVGPARTADDYERKARTTAEAATSAVETVRLLAETASDGKAFAAYTNVSLSEQEDLLASIRSDFESIQPPGASSDSLRMQLVPLLDDAMAHVADVRIVARRGHLDDLDTVAAPLADDADALGALLEALG